MAARYVRFAAILGMVVFGASAAGCKKRLAPGTCRIDIDCKAGFDCKGGQCVERPRPPWEQTAAARQPQTAAAPAARQPPAAPGVPGAPPASGGKAAPGAPASGGAAPYPPPTPGVPYDGRTRAGWKPGPRVFPPDT